MDLILLLCSLFTLAPLGLIFCCCADPITCTIVSDGFASNSIANYTQVSGTWVVDTFETRLETSDDNARILINTPSPVANRGVITVNINSAANTRTRVLGNYVDGDNYLFAEMEFTASATIPTAVRLGKVVAGVETIMEECGPSGGGSFGADQRLTLCWDGEWATAMSVLLIANVAPTACRQPYTPFVDGFQAGVEAIDAAAPSKFDNLLFARHYVDQSDCPQCRTCTPCGDQLPSEAHVEFSGVVQPVPCTFTCCECDDWNDTMFVLDRLPGSCTYRFAEPGPCPNTVSGNTFITLAIGSTGFSFSFSSGYAYQRLGAWSAPIVCADRAFTITHADWLSPTSFQGQQAQVCDVFGISVDVVLVA